MAAKAGLSKMLIYRYFESLDGLIVAYIERNDYWINLELELPEVEHLGEFVKKLFRDQITMLRNSYTLRRLYRWELSAKNKVIKELRERREAKGIWLIDAVSRLTDWPKGGYCRYSDGSHIFYHLSGYAGRELSGLQRLQIAE